MYSMLAWGLVLVCEHYKVKPCEGCAGVLQQEQGVGDACPGAEPGMAGWPGTGASLPAVPTYFSCESLWRCGCTLKEVNENQKCNKASFREALCYKLGLL